MVVHFTAPQYGLEKSDRRKNTSHALHGGTWGYPSAIVELDPYRVEKGTIPDVEIRKIKRHDGEIWVPESTPVPNHVDAKIRRQAWRKRLNRWSDLFIGIDVEEFEERDVELPSWVNPDVQYAVGVYLQADGTYQKRYGTIEAYVEDAILRDFSDGMWIVEQFDELVTEEVYQWYKNKLQDRYER